MDLSLATTRYRAAEEARDLIRQELDARRVEMPDVLRAYDTLQEVTTRVIDSRSEGGQGQSHQNTSKTVPSRSAARPVQQPLYTHQRQLAIQQYS